MKSILPLLLLLSSCASKPFELPRSPYQGVEIGDGITKKEAETIAWNYELMFIGCGGITEVVDDGDRWTFHGTAGVAATPIERTYLEKATGSIVSTVGPSTRLLD